MDVNEVYLVGRIGNKVKFAISKTGREYVYFPVEIEDSRNAKEEGEYNRYNIIHVMSFNKKDVSYLKRVDAKKGSRVIVEGYISTYKSTIKGQDVIENGVCSRKVYIVKTKVEDKTKKKEESN